LILIVTIVDWLLSIVCLSILNNRLAKPSQQPIKASAQCSPFIRDQRREHRQRPMLH
jgi:hypothetical protein